MISAYNAIYQIIVAGAAFFIGLIELALWWYIGFAVVDSFAWKVAFIFLGIICGVLVGAYSWLLLRIPFELSVRFDVLKNKVALRDYASVDEFQQDVASFLLDFFKFPGLRIQAGYFKFNGAEPLYVNVDFDASSLVDRPYDKIEVLPAADKRKAFVIPVIIGKHCLGEMILFTRGFTLYLMKDLLSDFENQYLDDQLLHVVYQTHEKQDTSIK